MTQLDKDLATMSILLDDQEQEVRDEWAQKDIWYWLTHFVYTYDPHATESIRKFPPKEHIKIVLDTLLEKKRILLFKSRQLLQTWTFCAFFLWDALYKEGRMTIFQAKNQEKANVSNPLHLCGRAKFIYDHLPSNIQQEYPMIPTKKPPFLYFPKTESYIIGGSQNPAFARQYTITGYLLDEMAFQERCMQTLGGIIPTLSPDCFFVGLSTVHGKNFFYRLLYDMPV